MPNIRMGAWDFEPAIFSHEELRFLLDHVDKPPVVALSKGVPKGVNVKTIQGWLERLYNLQQLQDHNGQVWAGYDAVKNSIVRYLAWLELTAEIRRRGGPPHASLYAWDTKGQAFKYGIDSDSGFVRNEILADGSRKPFGLKLLEKDGVYTNLISDIAPWLKQGGSAAVQDEELIVVKNGKFGKFECPICGKSEEFQTASRNAENLARSRIAKHLKSARQEVARHRALYRKKFESATTRI